MDLHTTIACSLVCVNFPSVGTVQLRLLLAIHGNSPDLNYVTALAWQLGVTQASASRALAELEDPYALISRHKGGARVWPHRVFCTLTPEGEQLVAHLLASAGVPVKASA